MTYAIPGEPLIGRKNEDIMAEPSRETLRQEVIDHHHCRP
jgi:hypothetical protein